MLSLLSIEQKLQKMMPEIIHNPHLHGRWLNTLSFLENCGARKLAASEHPTKVKEEMLKHAAEEFRHAHHLKKQISKVTSEPLEQYFPRQILGGLASLHYLNILDTKTCRYLKEQMRLSKIEIQEAAYLLVTYAIEIRASILYPIYHEALKQQHSPVSVKSILLEEEEHLAEILAEIGDFSSCCAAVCLIEERLSSQWLDAIAREMDELHKSSCNTT